MRSPPRGPLGSLVALVFLVGCAQPTAPGAPSPAPDMPFAGLPLLLPCAGMTGTSLAFSALSGSGDFVDIYGVTAAGEVVAFTDDGKSSFPAFSPDSKSLVFARAATRKGSAGGPPPSTSLWTMDTNGGNERKIVDILNAELPSYSPDGSMIAFMGVAEAEAVSLGYRIHLMSADGTNIRRVTDESVDGLPESDPTWSPDGTQLAFVRAGSRNGQSVSQLWSLALTSGAERLLHEITSEGGLFDLSWAPSGDSLLFTVRSESGFGRTAVLLNVATGELTRAAESVMGVAHSPGSSGDVVFFTTRDGGGLQVTDTSEATAGPTVLVGPEVTPLSRIAVAPCKGAN